MHWTRPYDMEYNCSRNVPPAPEMADFAKLGQEEDKRYQHK